MLAVVGGLALATGPVQAAGPAIGVGLGLSVSHFAYDRPENLPLPEDRYGSIVSPRGGVYGAFPVGSALAVMAGASYESNGGDARVDDGATVTDRVHYATLALLLEASRPVGGARPFARLGLECGFRVDADQWITVAGRRSRFDADELYPAVEWTLHLGGGVRFLGRWDVGAGYRHGLGNLNNSFNRVEHPIHHRAVVIGVTRWFSRGGA